MGPFCSTTSSTTGGNYTRPLTNNPWLWDQYEQARARAPAVVAQIDAAFGGQVRVFAAGHSLGGGLAQHAALVCPRIEKVFAFNSPPLPGYFDLPRKERQRPGHPQRTYLVYESYEVPTLFRAVPVYLNRFAKTRTWWCATTLPLGWRPPRRSGSTRYNGW